MEHLIFFKWVRFGHEALGTIGPDLVGPMWTRKDGDLPGTRVHEVAKAVGADWDCAHTHTFHFYAFLAIYIGFCIFCVFEV